MRVMQLSGLEKMSAENLQVSVIIKSCAVKPSEKDVFVVTGNFKGRKFT